MKAICFDLDGTLIDSLGFWKRIDRMYVESKGLVYDDELHKKMSVAALSEAQKIFTEHYNNEVNFDDMYVYIDKIMHEYYAEKFPYKECVEEKLIELKKTDFILTITTSTPSKHVDALVKRLGLDKYMDYIFTPDSFGVAKNKPEFFEKVIEKLGVKAEEVYVFDDTYYNLELAKSLGMVPIGVYDYTGVSRGDEIQDISKFSIETFCQLDIEKL